MTLRRNCVLLRFRRVDPIRRDELAGFPQRPDRVRAHLRLRRRRAYVYMGVGATKTVRCNVARSFNPNPHLLGWIFVHLAGDGARHRE